MTIAKRPAKSRGTAKGKDESTRIEQILGRIAAALEHRYGSGNGSGPWNGLAGADAFVWEAEGEQLVPVPEVASLPIALLKGVDSARDILLENTRRFAAGLPANNALLWGARGMGKSSLIKAVHAEVNRGRKPAARIALIEIPREDVSSLPHLLRRLRHEARRVILFCDDLSFDRDDTSYKSLKAALEGGVEGRPANVVFYATSNRRHLMPRDMMENERSTAINPSEAVEEKVSLSDRFGLWLGFHNCNQDAYFDMIRGYAAHFGLKLSDSELTERAVAWSAARGARSGRVAWQFIQDLAGSLGKRLA
jgi:predicted AAA+ superfamily ATPase